MIVNGLNASCYGCGVCAVVCPENIIKIQQSQNGFLVPFITNNNLCTHCNKCIKVCSFLDTKALRPLDSITPHGFSGYSIDKSIVSSSSSGGIGSELVSFGLQNGIKVCGVKYDLKQRIAKHIILSQHGQQDELKGSKYLQSYTEEAFKSINLNEKYFVFGTPCQIDSFRRFLRLKKFEHNFILIDFFCHGVATYHLWNNYLNMFEKQNKQIIINKINFRSKKFGWHNYTMAFHTNSNIIYSRLDKNDLFLNFYLGNYCLNKECYTCKYRGVSSAADIRLGDFWGEKFRNNKDGVSAIIAFTQKGLNVIEELKKRCEIQSEPVDQIIQGQLKGSITFPKNYNLINYSLQNNNNLLIIYLKYAYIRLIKNAFPIFLKNIIKKLIKSS